jgi:FAD:protein FMN transferase
VIRLALEAMATRFELVIHDEGDPHRLRAIGQQSLAEIERAERQWSRFLPTSEIAWVNAAAGGRPVSVGPETFGLLAECRGLARATGLAFDPTVGPLLRAWGIGGPALLRPPDAAARARALRLVGMDKLELDESRQTVRLPERGMELDLGAIGKGKALDRAASVLRENGVAAALLHGGTSSVHCVGRSPGGAWRIGWNAGAGRGLGFVALDERRPALSVSAPHGRRVSAAGRSWGHVIDPRTGEPVDALPALVTGASGSTCDALSTAVLVGGDSVRRVMAERFPGFEAHIVVEQAVVAMTTPHAWCADSAY